MPDLLEPTTRRLSVIIPTRNCRAVAERAVQSVLAQSDSIGTEILVADDASRDGTAEHLEEIFPSEISQGRLRVEKFDRCNDPGVNRNRGAGRATGAYLAFLNPQDSWKPGRLEWLVPLLKKTDLLLTTREEITDTTDWIRILLDSNWAITSGGVVRRTLFDEVGGFPEGYFGAILPKRLPGSEDYEFWIRCLIHLVKNDQRDRFRLERDEHVVMAESQLPPQIETLKKRIKGARELITLLQVTPALPTRYWSTIAKRISNTGRYFLKRK